MMQVKVVWRDPKVPCFMENRSWVSREEANVDLAECTSVGFVVKDTDDALIIASNYYLDSDTDEYLFSGLTFLLKSSVVTRSEIK